MEGTYQSCFVADDYQLKHHMFIQEPLDDIST